MEFLANDRLRLRIRRSAHKAGRFEPPLPSPSGGRLDSSKQVHSSKQARCPHRATRVSKWLPITAKSILQRQQSAGLIPRRGLACYARATAKSAIGEPRAAHGPTGTATRFWPSASGQPAMLPPNPGICPPTRQGQCYEPKPVGQVAVPAAHRAAPEERPRIVLTKPKESGRRYKIFINVTHPPCGTPHKSNLTNSLSTTSEVRPLPKKQKMWDNLRQYGTLVPPSGPATAQRQLPAPIAGY